MHASILKALTNSLLIAVMLLSLVGESFASGSENCAHMMTHSGASMAHVMNAEGTDHPMSMHKMMHADMDMTSSESPSKDCCELECDCVASSCSSLNMLSSQSLTAEVRLFSHSIEQSSSLTLTQAPLAIYRPPIFA